MNATLVDSNYSQRNQIGGYRAMHRIQFDCGAWVNVGRYSEDFSVRTHYHPIDMVDTVILGQGRYCARGIARTCAAGAFIVVRAGELHDVRPERGEMVIVSIGATPRWREELMSSAIARQGAKPEHQLALNVFRMFCELQDPDHLTSVVAHELAVSTLSTAITGLSGRNRSAPKWLARVKERLQDEPHTTHGLRELALGVGVHFTHLARAFRADHGCTIGEYQRGLRISRSMSRLVNTRDPLALIAHEAGFCDQSHYHRWFRRYVGTSPNAFRKLASRMEVRKQPAIRKRIRT